MAPTDDFSPYSPPKDHGRDNRFSARIESFRDISGLDFGGYNDGFTSPPLSPAGRHPDVSASLPLRPAGGSPDTGRSHSGPWSQPFSPDTTTTTTGGYHSVTGSGPETRSGRGGTSGQASSARRAYGSKHSSFDSNASVGAILEERESVDIALLPAAAPIDGNNDSHQPSWGSSRHLEGSGISPTSFTPRPASRVLDEQTKIWQEQEQAGQLTGGLGAGFKPATRIREEDLLSPTSPIMNRMPSRAMSFSRRKSFLNRSATRKMLGQSEADRTGQPVQVIIEEPESELQNTTITTTDRRDSRIDLSFVAGDEMPVVLEELRVMSKVGTFPLQKIQRVETFYPQPDWKPLSMRWPYLVMLILLSFILAGLSEVLYRHSAKDGLVTFTRPSDIAGFKYFAIKFLPTLTAVLYGVLWQMTEFDVKRLEPFYQLSKEGGATAAESLNVDYITSFLFLRPIRTLQRRHYAVTLSTVASILAVSAVPTLCSASLVLLPDRDTRLKNPNDPKYISVNAIWSRVLEAVLIITALLGCALLYQLSTRRSGLLADVKGIAGLAGMANVSHILMDFKDMDVATHKDIHHKLANRRYQLRNSSLAPVGDQENDLTTKIMGDPIYPSEESAVKYHHSINPHPLMFRAWGSIPFITGIILFSLFLPTILFTPAGDLTDQIPWIVTMLAVSIKLAWGAIDTTMRIMEPFYILYRRHAPPKTLTLDYNAMAFGWVAIAALFNRHYLVFAVGLGTIMTEILTVLVTSLVTVDGRAFASIGNKPGSDHEDLDAGEETVHSFWISLAFTTAILFYMGVVATLVFVRRRKPFLPRQPNTIASVLGYIHQSKMLYDFVGTEKKSNVEMRDYLSRVGRTYGLGWFEGRDGRTHCGVDQEELSASYRHGIDFSRSNMPWVENFTEWL